MNQLTNRPHRDPNPKTRSAHRKEFIWQIIFPLLLTIIILAAIVTVIVLKGVGTVSNWADIALIVLILPAMIILILPLGIVILLIIGSSRILGIIPGYAHQVHRVFRNIRMRVQDYCDLPVKPLIYLMSIFTMTKSVQGRGDREDFQVTESHENT